MIHSKHFLRKEIAFSLFVFSYMSLFGQADKAEIYVLSKGEMLLTFLLPKVDSGRVDILHMISEDSTSRIYSNRFNGNNIVINLQLEDSILRNDPLLQYVIFFSDSSRTGRVFPGENDAVTYDVGTRKFIRHKENKFYNLTQLTNEYKGDSTQNDLIVKELVQLYKKNPSSDYISFFIYKGATGQDLAEKDLINFNLENNNNYWIKKLRDEYIPMSNDSLSSFMDTLKYFTTNHELVLLKFWGSWCRPCLADNEKIEKLVNEGTFKPFILGIQNDKKASEKITFYTNVLDNTRVITTHYEVRVFPTYILLQNGNQVLRVTRLHELLSFLK